VVTAIPELTIEKIGPAAIAAGQAIQYTITVNNTGLSDATNFMVTDQVPATIQQVQWQAVTNGPGVINGATSGTGNTISLSGNLPAGANNNITITVNGITAGNATGTIVNSATVTPAEPGALPQTAVTTTNVTTSARMRITKTGPAVMIRGAGATYVINVVNPGPSDAVNASITDLVPDVLTNVSWTATASGSTVITNGATGTGNAVSVTANMPAADTSGVTIVVKGLVSQTAPAGSVINTAHVKLSDPAAKDIVSLPVVSRIGGAADLSIQKTGPGEVYTGNVITYLLTVNNNGPSDANGATVTDMLPAGILQPVISVAGGTGGAGNIQATITGNNASAILGTFPVGAQVVLQIAGTAGLPGIINNVAVVNPPAGVTDVDSTNNTSNTVITNVLGKAQLRILKMVNPPAGPYSVGQKITYTISATNTGSIAVNPVVVTDNLPAAGLITDPVYSAPPKGNIVYNSSQRILTWNIDLLNPGETVVWSYNVTIAGAGKIQNTAVVTGPPDVALPDTSTVLINTDNYANLKVLKQLNTPAPLSVNQVLQFTITAINNGPNTATNVIVKDQLANVLGQPVVVTTSKGQAVYDPVSGSIVWQIAEMTVGATETLTFTAKVISGGVVTNTATIMGDQVDVDLTDNTATIPPVKITGEEIFIPNVITPNGDGKNDAFVIVGIERYPGSVLLIYNRWGNQVFQSKNYQNEWRGTGLNDGTYYYILKLNTPDGIRPYKGWIELLR
jgi:gliding motility-associated-like protein/uncharacterized repeat protein (TIGR01451 family)